jgi:EAL domain-containing protein (putative c-di-GMP-specific phosphodiesterase class I)
LHDIPSAAAPRSTHLFLLVLALCAGLFLRDEPLAKRLTVAGICLFAFVFFAGSNAGMGASYALPDSIRIPGTWVNASFAIAALYVLMHLIVSDLSHTSALEVDMRKGIKRTEFVLLYQPQVTSRGEVVGAEALLRWMHPQRGQVDPGDFIALAEHTGLILPLGMWVLGTACTQLVEWSRRADTVDLTLAINVSALQFAQADFIAQVQAALERTGAPAYKLKLELTESMLVHDLEDIIRKMCALKELGVGISMDDFGTGYSSLSNLKRLPLDQLKIDQSFVRDVLTDANDASIAKTIINLGKSLNFTVVAEGVETPGQRDFLMDNGCHTFQGYLFSQALTPQQFMHYVAQAPVPYFA